jgi:ABC-type transport system involved in multi-copper enzyme maturation permease subunit
VYAAWLIAANTVRAGLRNRILYVILLFGLMLIGLTETVARLENAVQVKVVKDFSYAVLSTTGFILVLVLAFDQVPAELESRTAHLILARPVRRRDFLLGKFAGSVALMSILVGGMGGLTVLLVGFANNQHRFILDGQMIQAIFLLWWKFTSVTALVIMLSLVCSRPLTLTLTVFVYVYAHVAEAFSASFTRSGHWLPVAFGTALELLLPNFQNLDYGDGMVENWMMSPGLLAALALYALTYTLLFLLASQRILAKRDL